MGRKAVVAGPSSIIVRALEEIEKRLSAEHNAILTDFGRTTISYRLQGMLDHGNTEATVMEYAKTVGIREAPKGLEGHPRMALWKKVTVSV